MSRIFSRRVVYVLVAIALAIVIWRIASIDRTDERILALHKIGATMYLKTFEKADGSREDVIADIELDGRDIRDRDMQLVARCPYVENLKLVDTNVSGSGVGKLTPLTRLTFLKWQGNVTDADLVALSTFQNLERVVIISDKITNEGVKTLAKLEKLKSVYLTCPQLTDDVVPILLALPNLDGIGLIDSKVTKKGIELIHKDGRDWSRIEVRSRPAMIY